MDLLDRVTQISTNASESKKKHVNICVTHWTTKNRDAEPKKSCKFISVIIRYYSGDCETIF